MHAGNVHGALAAIGSREMESTGSKLPQHNEDLFW
jgi:hypothetical protein